MGLRTSLSKVLYTCEFQIALNICVSGVAKCTSGSSAGGRQSGAVLYSAFGVMGEADNGVRHGVSKSNGSSGSQTGSGYSTDVSDDNLPNDAQSPASEPNNNSDSDEQVLM